MTSTLPEAALGVEHWVEHDGVRIYVWEKVLGDAAGRAVVVLAHGSSTAGRESFDLQVPHKPTYSLMDVLASEGFDVFALDVRGFGRSTRPDGHLTTAQASEDLGAVVQYVTNLRRVSQVNLLGWSWGTQYCGLFLMAHPEKTARYVSYAQMHVDSPDLARRRPRIDAFRNNAYVVVPEAGWKARFRSMTPPEASDEEVVEAYAQAAARVEHTTPTGPQLDMVALIPIVNPTLLRVPTTIIHGEHDDVADLNGLLPFFRDLPHPHKRYIVVPGAGHMMHLQKAHPVFQHEVASFFRSPIGQPVPDKDASQREVQLP